jgi:hypothetical protein
MAGNNRVRPLPFIAGGDVYLLHSLPADEFEKSVCHIRGLPGAAAAAIVDTPSSSLSHQWNSIT